MALSCLRRMSLMKSCVRSVHTSRCLAMAKLYSSKHEWVELVGDSEQELARVGVTQYAADALGDVVFAQLPKESDTVEAGSECGAVESVKAASEVYSPVSGVVTQFNQKVEDKPGLINSSPEEDAWLFELNLTNRIELKDLMDKEGYEKFLSSVKDDLE